MRTLSLLLLLAALGEVVAAQTPARQKQVLVLYSTRRDSQIAIVGERELPRILDNGLTENLDYYSEYIDQARFPEPEYKKAFLQFLRTKYREQDFDLVITMDDIGLGVFASVRSEVFPKTPIVSYVISPDSPRPANATGIVAVLDFAGTITMALALQPDLQNVFVISGADNATPTLDVARAQFKPFETRLTFTYLRGLKDKDLQQRLASLPPHSIVYYLSVGRDSAGENFHPLEYLDRVVAASNAPVYCWVDSAMDRGIVGGSLKSQQAEIDALGQLALRVLHGAHADSIPWSAPDLNVRQVNARVLQRFGIDESRIPPGTLIKFRDPSVWNRYGVYIVGAAVVLLAQTALIAGLVLQRARRQKAEAQVRGSREALRKSYERIRDLGGRLLHAQENERARIARDLHDDIGQQVALLAIDLELMGSAPNEQLSEDAMNRVQTLSRSVHDLSHRLHPAKLRLIGLVPAIMGLQREPSHASIPTDFEHDSVPAKLPPDVTLCLFRIVQEALQNANKHSGARLVKVALHGRPGGLTLTVADDGAGFDVEAAWGKGLGLLSMRERVEAIGGTMKIQSGPGAGTLLEVTVPLRADSA
jgi:signal transduction histidine kinase